MAIMRTTRGTFVDLDWDTEVAWPTDKNPNWHEVKHFDDFTDRELDHLEKHGVSPDGMWEIEKY